MKEIYILGVGHNTPVIIELAELCGYSVKGLYHYEKGRTGEKIHGYEIIGTNDELFLENTLSGKSFAMSMGDNKLRSHIGDLIRSRSGIIPSLVHPTASVSKYATIEEGVIIQANSTIQPDVLIKKDTVISFNVGISHNVVVEKSCYVACQTIVGAYTHIMDFAFIGMGVTTVSGKVPYIGTNAIIGAGAVVLKPVEDDWIVKGNPAKRI